LDFENQKQGSKGIVIEITIDIVIDIVIVNLLCNFALQII
jgi:hypothetical protein